MEFRYILEIEILKREYYVVVQLLKEECGILKVVIQCLRSKEGFVIFELIYFDVYQIREICFSDFGLDWGQGIYFIYS